MSLSRSSALLFGRASVTVALLVILPLALGGCATSQARSYEPATRVSSFPPNVAGPHGATIEMEDDGIPVQPPPVASRSHEPDDPSEPFSPNYGRAQESLNEGTAVETLPAPHREASSAAVPRSYVAISH